MGQSLDNKKKSKKLLKKIKHIKISINIEKQHVKSGKRRPEAAREL